VLTRVLEREGVVLRTGVQAERVSTGDGGGPVLHLADGTAVSASHLLVAVGREPVTDDLGLEAAGVRTDDSGRVVTDDRLQAAPTVWAAGDCTATLQFTHVGDEQGRIAAGNALAGRRIWKRSRWKDEGVPWVTFTEPEVAHVGLTEAQALDEHGDEVRVSIVRDTDSDRGRAASQTDGFVKLIAVPGTVGGMALGKLVGMTVVGPSRSPRARCRCGPGRWSDGWRRRSTPTRPGRCRPGSRRPASSPPLAASRPARPGAATEPGHPATRTPSGTGAGSAGCS
jgi:pyruvate/2-oxoglutarate dehydrogenase complex dihydrolipoamide dehydrogenase (E3) component